jgi:hypothetical protein
MQDSDADRPAHRDGEIPPTLEDVLTKVEEMIFTLRGLVTTIKEIDEKTTGDMKWTFLAHEGLISSIDYLETMRVRLENGEV